MFSAKMKVDIVGNGSKNMSLLRPARIAQHENPTSSLARRAREKDGRKQFEHRLPSEGIELDPENS